MLLIQHLVFPQDQFPKSLQVTESENFGQHTYEVLKDLDVREQVPIESC